MFETPFRVANNATETEKYLSIHNHVFTNIDIYTNITLFTLQKRHNIQSLCLYNGLHKQLTGSQ